jgi:hypothetical protein
MVVTVRGLFRGLSSPSTISLKTRNKYSPHLPSPQQQQYPTNQTKTWDSLQQTLCGTGTPNLRYAKTLFQLAREEVFPPNENHTYENGTLVIPSSSLSSSEPASKFLGKFYVGNFGASIYINNHVDDGNDNNGTLVTMYVRLWKCANNQIRAMENTVWKNRNGTFIKNENLVHALKNYLFSNIDDDDVNSYNKRKSQLCIYTAIRDPVSHFLSGYNEMEFRIINGIEFTDDGLGLAAYSQISYSESDETRRRRFTQFVKDVLLEDPLLADHYVYHHFMPMSRILPILNAFNLTLTGYIPTIHNITQTWPEFMANTCAGFPPVHEIPKMRVGVGHRSSLDELGLYRAAKEVWKEGGAIARALCIIHAFDYACWTDLTEGIPPICQQVFDSHSFVQAIGG